MALERDRLREAGLYLATAPALLPEAQQRMALFKGGYIAQYKPQTRFQRTLD